MYRVILECLDVPANEGLEDATDIERDFREYRPHHYNVKCTFVGGKLVLQAENDFDPDGLGLMDEFSDVISCNVSPFDGDVRIVSSTVI
jgi:hypothetical protein